MQGMTYRRRVAAYVIRTSTAGPELLVFDHVDDDPDHPAGTQVPAGGVLPFESIEQAAHREVAEETGVTGATVIGRVGRREGLDGLGRPSRTTYVHLTVATHAGARAWVHRVPGLDERAAAAYRAAERVWEQEGGAELPDSWSPTTLEVDADAGLLFACRWERLPLSFELAADQGVLLDRVRLGRPGDPTPS